ncbi:hypothetical protein GCM10020295_34160 [Streptomyces cinereospinus]
MAAAGVPTTAWAGVANTIVGTAVQAALNAASAVRRVLRGLGMFLFLGTGSDGPGRAAARRSVKKKACPAATWW